MHRGITLNTTKFSVMDASKAFKKSRTTIYEAIKNGELSRDNDGLLDLSELIRVYGNPTGVQFSTRTEHVQKDPPVHVQSEIEHVLKDQISLLKNQLELANQREKSLMQHIEDLTHRIEFKGVLEPSNNESQNKTTTENTVIRSIDQAKDEGLTTQPESEDKSISVSKPIEEKPKKRGLFGRLSKVFFED